MLWQWPLSQVPYNRGKTQGASTGGETASDPKPSREAGSELWEGQDSLWEACSLPHHCGGDAGTEAWWAAPSSWGAITALQSLKTSCILRKASHFWGLAVFPLSHKHTHLATQIVTLISWCLLWSDAAGTYIYIYTFRATSQIPAITRILAHLRLKIPHTLVKVSSQNTTQHVQK